ncbi:hypothetical protein TNCV_5061891 [Trichonephila clavipes]|nr:hypothetical protein TNCV_5061891 [Trichonephila clavipes]
MGNDAANDISERRKMKASAPPFPMTPLDSATELPNSQIGIFIKFEQSGRRMPLTVNPDHCSFFVELICSSNLRCLVPMEWSLKDPPTEIVIVTRRNKNRSRSRTPRQDHTWPWSLVRDRHSIDPIQGIILLPVNTTHVEGMMRIKCRGSKSSR